MYIVIRIYLKILLLITETFCFIVLFVVVVEQRNIKADIDCCFAK